MSARLESRGIEMQTIEGELQRDFEQEKTGVDEIEFRAWKSHEDSVAFRKLNEEWIVRFFTLETKDRETLNHPEEKILGKGGRIFMAYSGDAAVGCVALIPVSEGVYELAKMAVAPELRGRGVGRGLLEYAIGEGRRLGAQSLYLASSTKLKNAVHLYESVGFQHIPVEQRPATEYARSDVFMEMVF